MALSVDEEPARAIDGLYDHSGFHSSRACYRFVGDLTILIECNRIRTRPMRWQIIAEPTGFRLPTLRESYTVIRTRS